MKTVNKLINRNDRDITGIDVVILCAVVMQDDTRMII